MLFNKYLSEIILCRIILHMVGLEPGPYFAACQAFKKVEITFLPKDSNPLI